MTARLFMFLIIIVVLLLFVTGIVLLVRWIVRSTEKNKRTSMGKLLQCIQNKRLSVLDAVKNYRHVKNFAVPAASSARCLRKVHSLHSSSLYIRRWDMCRMHPPAA